MTSRTVKSPAGDTIEIVSDDDWVATAGITEKSLRMWYAGAKRFILTDLWLGGEVSDPQSGRAVGKMWERMAERFPGEKLGQPTSFAGLATDAMNAAAFQRNTNGKRTYSVKLVAMPEIWYQRVLEMVDEFEDTSPIPPDVPDLPEPVQPSAEDRAAAVMMESVVFPTPTDDEFQSIIDGISLDAPTQYTDPTPPLEFSVASQVAMSLLTTVVEIISAGSSAQVDEKVRALQGDLNDVMAKLAQRLEENDRMRRQLRAAGDEITALRHERDGLRSRLRATEANLTAALKGDAAAAVNSEIQRRVDQIMRVSPTTKGDDG